MSEIDPRAQALLASAGQVDIMDVAGAIVANPERAMVSVAAKLALALFAERAWEVCLEADLLARAVTLPADAASAHAIRTQADRVRTLMAALCGETQEMTDATD